LLAIPGLIWVASSAISSLEYAINVANGSAPLRRFWHSRLKSLAVLTAGFLLLSISLVGGSLIPRLEALRTRLQIPGEPLDATLIDSWPVVLGGTLLAFAAFYKWLPRGHIGWGSAFGGALLALALWEGARGAFTEFLERSPSFGLMTGTLAGVVAFLIWIYTAVAIVLLGAELSSAVNGRSGGQRPSPLTADRP
jgi:membrane protein